MISATAELRIFADLMEPHWPKKAERVREIAGEYSRMVECLDQMFAAAREEQLAMEAGRGSWLKRRANDV